MEWYWILLAILGGLFALLAMGMHIAFAFMLVTFLAALIIWGGPVGIEQIILNMKSHMIRFTLLPIALFILMGDVMFHSGIAIKMIDTIDRWLGRLPGRLGLVAVVSGTLLATLTGQSMASCAILGSTLTPEMERRGYAKPMSLGPIMGSGGLAIMIPPSSMAVYLCALAEVSIPKVLMGIIIPGLAMAVLYAIYIVIICTVRPSIAPPYSTPPTPLLDKLIATGKYILPIGFVVFLVTGVILLGIATPSEAAATGAIGTFLLAASYGKLNWSTIKKTLTSSARIIVMMFIILAGAFAYTQILTFSGASKGLVALLLNLQVHPLIIFIAVQVMGLILGMFIPSVGMFNIIVPLFMPVILKLGMNPVWFIVIMLINGEIGVRSPPFGLTLFAMKGVAPPNTTMEHIYKAVLPFLSCDLLVMALIIAFPAVALWLPGVMVKIGG